MNKIERTAAMHKLQAAAIRKASQDFPVERHQRVLYRVGDTAVLSAHCEVLNDGTAVVVVLGINTRLPLEIGEARALRDYLTELLAEEPRSRRHDRQ